MIEDIIKELKDKGVDVGVRECILPEKISKKKTRKNHNKRKLTDEQARYIRMEYRRGKSYYRLAIKFGVNSTIIKQIVEYKSYKKALGLPKAVKGENIYV